ncbi:MAG: methyl-accepting chemotaxis protein [Pseudomonadales bacterium]|nr:methyl-accepting chemotaxis protein [Pseudomonadales bacterium]RLU03570.1 MAG: methyl-accepting chemotaxis protein [Ketobacter sp.]
MLLNMSVAKRLSGGIGIVVLSLVALTMFVMSAFKDEHATTDLIHTNYVPGTSTLYSADRDLQQALVAERTMHATRPGSEDFAQLMNDHAENVQQARDRVDKFYALLPDEELTRLMGAYVKLRDDWEASTNQIVSLAQSSNGADREQALKLSIGPGAEKFEAMRGVLDQMQDRLEAMLSEKNAEATANYNTTQTALTWSVVGVVLFSILLSYLLMRSISGPLQTVLNVVQQMAQGELSYRTNTLRKDEFGVLLQAMDDTMDRLSDTVNNILSTSESLTNASSQVSATAQSVSQATTEQAASVEQISASVEEMSASVDQNADNAKVTDSMASQAAQQASEGGEAVRQTVEAMKQIAEKISIIDDIAYQTNLLALNAAIEAGRAGQYGKGFAVVADEVRKLAERSRVAAQEIGDVAGSNVQLAERAGQLLNEMVPAITKTSDLVQEIAAASVEQSGGLGQVNSAMNQMSQITQQNAAASEELAATSEEMSGQARHLQQLMAFFKVQAEYQQDDEAEDDAA